MAAYCNRYYYSSFQPRSEISLFNGDGVDQWLHQIECFFIRYQTAPEQKFVVAVPYLSGEAMEWYRQMWLARRLSTWDNFVVALRHRFKPPEIQRSRAELFGSMWNVCEELKQTLTEMKTQNSVYMENFSKLKSHVSSISTSDFSIEKVEESDDAAQTELITTELYAPDESDLVSKNTVKEVIVVEDIVEDTESVDLILDSSETWSVSKPFGMDTTSIYSGICSFEFDLCKDVVGQFTSYKSFETQICAIKSTSNLCLSVVCENASMSVPFIVDGVFVKPPAKPPEDGCSKSFDCIKFDSSAILDIKSLNWASIVGVIVHYDGLVIRLKLMGVLENITIFLKKRHDDAEGLLKFKIDNNLNILRKVGCVDNGNMMYELLAAGHFSESYNGLYRNVKLDCSATGIQFMDKEISVWVLHRLVVNAFKFLTTWVLSADHVACLRNLVAEYSTFLVKSDSNTVVKSAPASMKWAAVVVNEEHDDKFDLLTVIVGDSKDDDFISDINHDTTLDESLVVGVTVRKVTSNIFLADFSSGLVLNHAEIREWRFETQLYALKGTLRSLLPTVCENVKMSLLSLLVGATNLIKSWCSVFMKPPAQPPDKSLNILHGLESFVNFKLMGVQYKHDILYDLHGGRITMTASIRGVKFGKISAPYAYEKKLVYIIAYCNLFVRDIVPFSWTPKLSYELGLEQTLNFLHKVVKHVIVGGSKLQFVKACDAFVEWENICGCLAVAMSASKGLIPKHFDIIGTNWVAISTAFCGEIVDLDLVDQASSDLAETNSDSKLNDLLQCVEPHVCLMHHTQFDSFTILNIESFNKAFSDEYSAVPSILEVIMVFDSHPELRQERLSHEVFQWGIGGMERLSDANADTISLQWEDLKQVLYGGQENMVQKLHPAVKALTDNTDIRLNHTVTKIYHGINKVMVTIEEGMSFVANVVIIIVSLGILKANLIEMKTKLSEWKMVLIHDLGVDNEEQVPSELDDVFHPNVEFMAVVPPTIYATCLLHFCKVTSQPNLLYTAGGGLAYDLEKFSGDAAAALKLLVLNFRAKAKPISEAHEPFTSTKLRAATWLYYLKTGKCLWVADGLALSASNIHIYHGVMSEVYIIVNTPPEPSMHIDLWDDEDASLPFSLPRPPEIDDLEDKVNFKGEGMLRTQLCHNKKFRDLHAIYYSCIILYKLSEEGKADIHE